MATTTKPTVQVFGKCPRDGDTCQARWFTCHIDHGAPHIATYECAPADPEFSDRPHPEHVREIERMHPGAVFVYLD